MPFATFEAFCAALCEVWGAPAPSLASDPDQEIAFTLTFQGLDMAFSAHAEADPDLFRLSVPTGVHPLGPELDAIKAILDTNYLLSTAGTPTRLAQQADGSLALQQTLRLSQVQVHGLVAALTKIAELLAVRTPAVGEAEATATAVRWTGNLLLRA